MQRPEEQFANISLSITEPLVKARLYLVDRCLLSTKNHALFGALDIATSKTEKNTLLRDPMPFERGKRINLY